MSADKKTKCPECNGTGAYKTDCWLCDGEMVVKVEKALAEGFDESDLEDAYEGECRCPADDCRGDSCELCEGDGAVTERLIYDEITRVLLTAKYGYVVGQRYTSHYGRVSINDALLSNFAGRECKDQGWISWFRSILGDEISLTPAGAAEADKRAFEWAKGFDVSLCHIDDAGRFADDGGVVP